MTTSLMEDFCDAIGISIKDLKSQERYSKVSEARFLYYKLCRDVFGWSNRRIAQETGHHESLPVYGINRVNRLIDIEDKVILEKYNKVKFLWGTDNREKAKKVLREYNRWRRGYIDEFKYSNKELGRAIDILTK